MEMRVWLGCGEPSSLSEGDGEVAMDVTYVKAHFFFFTLLLLCSSSSLLACFLRQDHFHSNQL